jgi:hypothetical protein
MLKPVLLVPVTGLTLVLVVFVMSAAVANTAGQHGEQRQGWYVWSYEMFSTWYRGAQPAVSALQ